MAREPLARRAGQILLYPLGRAFVALWVHSAGWPRWVPSLPRFTRSAGFRRLQSAAAAWSDRNFELIEAHARWLDRIGCRVFDRCDIGLDTRPFSFPPDPPSLTCRREVTVVYGLDGVLPRRLAGLSAVLGVAGWGDSHDGTTAVLEDLDRHVRPVRGVTWSPVAGHGLPAGLETMPPERRFPLDGWLYMSIDWASRKEPAAPETTEDGDQGSAPRTATATYQPVEVTGTGVGQLVSQALERHEHAVAVRIEMTYYLNANVNARPGRLRKRLLPVRRDR